MARYLLVTISCTLVALWALEVLVVWAEPDPYSHEPFGDAITYLAAGERLNDGHALYALSAEDRPVMILSFPAPLLSPPAIAAIWRPLAALGDFGFTLWVVAAWFGLLGTIAYVVHRIGLIAAVVVAALSWPLGEMLAAANMSVFFPGLLLLAWIHRGDPRFGALIGAMAVLKLAPASLAGWWLGTHRAAGIAAVAAGVVTMSIVGLIGAGIDAHFDYIRLTHDIQASDLSVAGRIAVPRLPFVVIPAGVLVSAALWRWPRASFVVSYVALLVGTPAVYVATFGLLIGLLVPFVDRSVDPGSRPRTRRRTNGVVRNPQPERLAPRASSAGDLFA